MSPCPLKYWLSKLLGFGHDLFCTEKDGPENLYVMWRIATSSYKYIDDKFLGNGFRVSRPDYKLIIDAMTGGVEFIGENVAQERFTISRQMYSGPVSSIQLWQSP